MNLGKREKLSWNLRCQDIVNSHSKTDNGEYSSLPHRWMTVSAIDFKISQQCWYVLMQSRQKEAARRGLSIMFDKNCAKQTCSTQICTFKQIYLTRICSSQNCSSQNCSIQIEKCTANKHKSVSHENFRQYLKHPFKTQFENLSWNSRNHCWPKK